MSDDAVAGRIDLIATLTREGKITPEQARELLELPAADADQLRRVMDLMLHPIITINADKT